MFLGQFLQAYSKDGEPYQVDATFGLDLPSIGVYRMSFYANMFCLANQQDCTSPQDFLEISLRFQDAKSGKLAEQNLLQIEINDLKEKNKWNEITIDFDIDTEAKRNFQVEKKNNKNKFYF